MKRLLFSLVVLGMTSSVAIGATTAYFSDTEVSSANTFTAGTLDLKLNGGDVPVKLFQVADLKPGSQINIGYGKYVLKNAGTLPGKVKISDFKIIDYENTRIEPEVEAGDLTDGDLTGELSQAFNLKIFVDSNKDGWFSTGETILYNGQMKNMPKVLDLNKTLAPMEEINVVFIMDWWNNQFIDDDQVQGDSMDVSVDFTLEQL